MKKGKKGNRKAKLLSVTLAVCMLLGVMPANQPGGVLKVQATEISPGSDISVSTGDLAAGQDAAMGSEAPEIADTQTTPAEDTVNTAGVADSQTTEPVNGLVGTNQLENVPMALSDEVVTHEFNAATLGGTTDKASISAGTKWGDDYFQVVGTGMTQRGNADGTTSVELGKTEGGNIQFTVSGTADVAFKSSSTGGSNTSDVALSDGSKLVANAEGNTITAVTGTTPTTVTYTGLDAGTYEILCPNAANGGTNTNRGARVYSITVTETKSSSGPGGNTGGDSSEKTWEFKYFGTSTSSKTNHVGDGADIKDKVTLYSCTYNEESGEIGSKGGKFVADSPADGESFYYTTINPTKENFYLQADVTIDYINPTLDGQEGFALMLRDSISGSGSFFSNTMSVSGTKLPQTLNSSDEVKDAIGVRDYTGIISNETAESNTVVPYRQAFSPDVIKKGETYRVSLEKTGYGYVSAQYEIEADGTTGDKIGEYTYYIPAVDSSKTSISSYADLADPMNVQEKNVAYLALVTARGCNATFSNIEFRVTPWTADEWHIQPTVYVDPKYEITSPSTSAESTYELVFKANADGTAKVSVNGNVVDTDVAITANIEFTKGYEITGDATFEVEFTPDPNYAISEFEKLSNYDTKTINKAVSYKTLPDKIYVASNGQASNGGTSYDDALDIETALKYASAGQTIYLKAETFNLSGKSLHIERGRSGEAGKPITMTTEGGYAIFDFGKTGGGFVAEGDYWEMSFFNITNTPNGTKGMHLTGNHNLVERVNFYNNGSTGMQVSGYSAEPFEKWPSYNIVKNCTAINNADAGYEDADGFAAKLTVGNGNVFDGCIAAYNADDGWDLFAKAGSGSIGAVTIQNSVAYMNGYVYASEYDGKGNISVFPEIDCDVNGTLTFKGGKDSYTRKSAGNGNGFKMGGTNMPGDHKLINSIAYDNKAKGFDSNSCPDIKIYRSTSYNNEKNNVAMYTNNKSAVTGYKAEGVLSFRKGTNVGENFTIQTQSSSDVYGTKNYFWDTESRTSKNTASDTVSEDWFISLDTSVEPTRNDDGSIDMHGLLLLKDEVLATLEYEIGACGKVWGQDEPEKATIWVVGDSTVSPFADKYYIPREGYGEEIAAYFNATVYNLAHSGASSKDFMTLGTGEYNTLMNGSDTVPALGDADTAGKFLIIGFGHNDEKTEEARYTNPNGSYTAAGSFANSLYENYIKPALDKGVTPVVVTPIVRLTDENTVESYNSASGHITTTTVVGDKTFEGGDYAKAIRDMCAALGDKVILADLTQATIEKNVALGEGAQYMHAFTGAKYAEDGVTMVGTGLDKTHTNSYGAKMNAWLIDQLTRNTALNTYSKGKAEPAYAADYPKAINPDYKVSDYKTPTEEEMAGSQWPVYTDADGNQWYGTVFGDAGGQGKITDENGIIHDYFNAVIGEDNSLNLSVTGNAGKFASASEGFLFYYTRLPAGTSFTLSATATVKNFAENNQVSYGLMARDDLYINTHISSTMGDFVAAGTINQGAYNCFGRKSTARYFGPAITDDAKKYMTAGDTAVLKIVGTADGFTLTYGENEPVSAGFDYALTAVDPDYIYVGFYVGRNSDVVFSNISLAAKKAQKPDDGGDEPAPGPGENGGNEIERIPTDPEISETIPAEALTETVKEITGAQTVSDLVQYMRKQIANYASANNILPNANVDNTYVIEVVPQVEVKENGVVVGVRTAEASDFPMNITLPYPKGINRDNKNEYKFVIGHLLADGQMEKFDQPAKLDAGLQIRITSASPFVIAWEKVDMGDDDNGDNDDNGDDDDDDNVKEGDGDAPTSSLSSHAPNMSTAARSPKTYDDSSYALPVQPFFTTKGSTGAAADGAKQPDAAQQAEPVIESIAEPVAAVAAPRQNGGSVFWILIAGAVAVAAAVSGIIMFRKKEGAEE